MGKTRKDTNEVKLRHFRKIMQAKRDDSRCVAVRLTKRCIKANTGIEISEEELHTIPYKYNRKLHAHSAAHRRSAKKSRARGTRAKKRGENNKIKTQIKQELCQWE